MLKRLDTQQATALQSVEWFKFFKILKIKTAKTEIWIFSNVVRATMYFCFVFTAKQYKNDKNIHFSFSIQNKILFFLKLFEFF